MESLLVQRLSGWGGIGREFCPTYRPEKRRGLAEILASGNYGHYIGRGLGRSYGDSALNKTGAVISFVRLNRFISFDPRTGVLNCEGGTSLAEIVSSFLPRGYFLPVTPGTRYVTVGGAIAADVHGKNHHKDGTFSNFVADLVLLTSRGEMVTCSPKENANLFWATVGGMGLTGLIVTARIKLLPVESAYVHVDYLPARNLEEALDAFESGDKDYRYSVAWIDCLRRGESLGRSVLIRGNHAPAAALAGGNSDPLAVPHRPRLCVPFNLPAFALNRWSVQAFNMLYYFTHPRKERQLVHLNPFFYPLDSVDNWNRMYGKRGFAQYQALFPRQTSRAGLRLLLERITSSARASFLAVLKACGEQGRGLLSYPASGYTLALDIKADQELGSLLKELDSLVLDHGGRLYLAKDCAMSASTFKTMYPRLDEFMAVKAKVDPDNKFSSTQSRRVGLTP